MIARRIGLTDGDVVVALGQRISGNGIAGARRPGLAAVQAEVPLAAGLDAADGDRSGAVDRTRAVAAFHRRRRDLRVLRDLDRGRLAARSVLVDGNHDQLVLPLRQGIGRDAIALARVPGLATVQAVLPIVARIQAADLHAAFGVDRPIRSGDLECRRGRRRLGRRLATLARGLLPGRSRLLTGRHLRRRARLRAPARGSRHGADQAQTAQRDLGPWHHSRTVGFGGFRRCAGICRRLHGVLRRRRRDLGRRLNRDRRHRLDRLLQGRRL